MKGRKMRNHKKPVPLWDPIDVLRTHGVQIHASTLTGVARPTICAVFRGKRRASQDVAIALEKFFIEAGLPLNRWDLLLYVEPGQSLEEYITVKLQNTRWAKKAAQKMLNGEAKDEE
jgi:hypothetical protein